jgi:hypothetical protein
VTFRDPHVPLHSDRDTADSQQFIHAIFENNRSWNKFVVAPQGQVLAVAYSRPWDDEGRWELFATRVDRPAFAWVSARHAGRYNPTDVVWWLEHEDTGYVIAHLLRLTPEMVRIAPAVFFRRPEPLPELCVLPMWTSHRPAQ